MLDINALSDMFVSFVMIAGLSYVWLKHRSSREIRTKARLF